MFSSAVKSAALIVATSEMNTRHCPTVQGFHSIMSTPVQTRGRIYLREPATVIPSPVPEQYEFLKAPIPQRKYRINFRHPAYDPDDNILFTLYAWDHAEGGIHHGLAHNACSIISDNRTDGYLSRTCDGEHGERIAASWDDVLPSAISDYYFYVPYPSSMCCTLELPHEQPIDI